MPKAKAKPKKLNVKMDRLWVPPILDTEIFLYIALLEELSAKAKPKGGKKC
jgi:hypothetical protein